MRTTRKTRRAARHLYRLCLVDGVVDEERARLVARRIAESGRRGSLALLTEVLRLLKLDRDRHTALVESATHLSDDLREHVGDELRRIYGPGMVATFADNPELIGGMRIRAGSDVYDESVRARLAALDAGW
jgi:F-type H+-transporting ATPase subunit delta